jgi:hypothetical protein
MGDAVLPEPAAPAMPIAKFLRRVRLRIPRSLVLALLGIGLSSWLLPAITRQWDDRQKAGELKAILVTEMATATGRAVLDAQAYASANRGASPAANAASVKEWSVASLEIRARLDAYFGPEAVDAWEVVTKYVNATLSRAYRDKTHDAFIPGRLERSTTTAPGLENLYSKFYDDASLINELAVELLRQEQTVARSILAMDVRGYSTSWDDIVSDLVPAA